MANITTQGGFGVMRDAFSNSFGAFLFLIVIFGLVYWLMKEKIIK